MKWKIKFMFQTTNQVLWWCLIYSSSSSRLDRLVASIDGEYHSMKVGPWTLDLPDEDRKIQGAEEL
jgi:hypothetical protein